MSDWDRVLPPGDREDVDVPRPGELPSTYIRRVRPEMDSPPDAPARTCGCRARGWVEQHGPSQEERLDAIFRTEPGVEG